MACLAMTGHDMTSRDMAFDAMSCHSMTSHHDMATMDEQGRTKYDDQIKTKLNSLGPYRNEGYWKEKGQFYSEGEPPPECPMHNMSKDFKEEQKKLTELNHDGD